MSSRPPGWREWSLIWLLAGIWSTSFLLIKLAVATLPPAHLAAGRLLLAAALLGGYLALRGQRVPWRAATPHWLFLGLFGNALPFYLIGWGEQTIDSALAVIFMGMMPLLTPLLAHWLIADERLSASTAAGAACGFAGLLLLVGPHSLAGIGDQLLAQLAMIGAAACYAAATVYTRRFAAAVPGTVMAAGATAAGGLMAVPAALAEAPTWLLRPAPVAWLALLALGLFATGLATLIYLHLIRTVGASRFSQVNYLIPMLGVLWGWLLLGERLAWNAWSGLGLILAGVIWVNRARPAATR